MITHSHSKGIFLSLSFSNKLKIYHTVYFFTKNIVYFIVYIHYTYIRLQIALFHLLSKKILYLKEIRDANKHIDFGKDT